MDELTKFEGYLACVLKMEMNKTTIERIREKIVRTYIPIKKKLDEAISDMQYNQDRLSQKDQSIETYTILNKRSRKSTIKLLSIFLAVSFFAFAYFSFAFYVDILSGNKAVSLDVNLITHSALVAASVFAFILFFVLIIREKRAMRKSRAIARQQWAREEAELSGKLSIAKRNTQICNSKIAYLEDVYRQLGQELGVAKSNLQNIYSENILPQKYVSNVVAIAAFYDYLSSGRCTIIKGHGGIYDTFEHDSRLQQIIDGLDDLFWQNSIILSEIRELQNSVSESNRLLTSYQRDVEQTLNGMSSSLNRIETNSAQTAIHSRNIDANVTYMRWAGKY